MSRISAFETIRAQTITEQQHLRDVFNQISRLRSMAAFAALCCIYAGARFSQIWGYPTTGLLVLSFLLLMRWHDRTAGRQAMSAARQAVAEGYLARRDRSWHTLPRNGLDYLAEGVPQLRDLDLMGPRSLYQFLCMANTTAGQDALARHLQHFSAEREGALKRQQAVQELLQKETFSLGLLTSTRRIHTEKRRDIEAEITTFADLAGQFCPSIPRALHPILWAMPILTCLSLILSLTGIINGRAALLPLLLMLAQLAATFFCHASNGRVLAPIFAFQRSIQPFASLFSNIESEKFDCALLREQQQKLQQSGGAVQALKHLSTIGGAVRMRYSGLLYPVLNALLLWDFHCVLLFDLWRRHYGTGVGGWLDAVGELEALASLGLPAQVMPVSCFPVLVEAAQPLLEFEDLRHPLLGERAVGNSLRMQGGIHVITGSNMSGKTTFLRSLGTALVLTMAGAPVPARHMTLSPMDLCTSIRVEDDVSAGISTFQAQILRIRDMVVHTGTGRPMLALIDEILGGTNSVDRIAGATGALQRLSVPWNLVVVSTHDLELCALEDDPRVSALNYHFSETWVGQDICYNYTIQPGRCRTTNARHLLRMAGILPEAD